MRSDDVMFGILVAAVVVFVAIVVFAVIRDVSSETFDLKKDEWKCTQSHRRSTLMMAGKVPVPVYHTICDKYERISLP